MLILPQLAQATDTTSLTDFIHDDSWVMEQKLDGHRLLLMSPGVDMPPTALTRNGTIYTRKLPRAIQDFRFPEGELILDGELVGDTYWVFDLPRFAVPQGEVGIERPLWTRRAQLEGLLAMIQHPFKIVPQAQNADQKIRLSEAALRGNFEGLVLKKVDAPYRSGGRTPEWLKVKFVATADCVVLDVRDDGKESARLGLVDGVTLVDVGRASLIGKEKNGTIRPGDVVEVRYLYCGAGNRLYQPTILRLRDDKMPPECTIDQLKMVNKEVLEEL